VKKQSSLITTFVYGLTVREYEAIFPVFYLIAFISFGLIFNIYKALQKTKAMLCYNILNYIKQKYC